MKLTRQVLIEKSSPFWSYANPDDVPDKVWEKSYSDLLKLVNCNFKINYSYANYINGKNNDEELNYVCKEIISPLVKIKEYEISNLMDDDPNDFSKYKRISIGKYKFYISLSLIISAKHFFDSENMRNFVCSIWENSNIKLDV